MKRNILDILACPIDKHYPLELIELDTKEEIYEIRANKKKGTENDEKYIQKNNNNNDIAFKDSRLSEEYTRQDKVIVIVDGILYCNKCVRFYPIIDEIPIMLPDELREKEKDLEFLAKWKDNIPEKILKHANPWHL
jgi:uncharacterized protein YbaR (Trm112 family)